jgi:site-specific DNA-methyltransferase (adenine-specific)
MLIHGDCLVELKQLEDDSVDSCVADGPYGLSFMGKKWDYDVPSVEIWKEVFRVLKPGGHLLSFSSSRTYHRMAVNIEDAGFEIRDQIMWLYGSGFPKSLNISKAIDAKTITGKSSYSAMADVEDSKGVHVEDKKDDSFIAYGVEESRQGKLRHGSRRKASEPITEEAQRWQGWGTALKPAHEPIVVARKPLIGTVAENVLEHSTGAMNIDGCRINHDDPMITRKDFDSNTGDIFTRAKGNEAGPSPNGRWPANVILDEEAGAMLDEQSGDLKSVKSKRGVGFNDSDVFGTGDSSFDTERGFNDNGGASRFFYCPKASRSERNKGCEDLEEQTIGRHQSSLDGGKMLTGSGNERSNKKKNFHPTVKPVDLMRYLCRLVTPPGGIVLDPFMGSGTTGVAAKLERFEFIGIEREEEYVEIARLRVESYLDYDLIKEVAPDDIEWM